MTTVRVEMPYIGSVITVNHMYHPTHHLKAAATLWREGLAAMIRCEISRSRKLFPPLKVIVSGQFKDKRSTPDLTNLKLIPDSVQMATGLNDRDYKVVFEEPVVIKGCEPTIYIEIQDSADAAAQAQPEPNTAAPRVL